MTDTTVPPADPSGTPFAGRPLPQWYDDAKFEEDIANALKETDATKRGEYYQQSEEQLLNGTVSAIPLNWYTGDHVFRDTIVNYDQQPLGNVLWEKIGKKG